jgi:N4-gp56 family major capsid protein
VPDVYTSIATSGGYSDNTVKAAYDLLFRWALNEMPQYRQFVDVRPQRPTMNGSSVTLQINPFFSDATVTAAKTPLTEESDVSATQMPSTTNVVLTPLEYGFANVRTLKLANRTMVPIDPVIARAVADHMRKVVDELIQDELANATNKQYSGSGNTAVGHITSTDTLTADNVRQAVLDLRVAQSIPWFGDMYAVGCHPSVVYELRKETGSGAWRVPNEYGVSQDRIWKGEIGAFEGCRFVENARTRVSEDGTDEDASGSGTELFHVARTYFFGREALAEAVVTEPHVVLGPVVDRLFRFRPIGWYGDFDHAIFRNQSLVLNYSGSTTLE